MNGTSNETAAQISSVMIVGVGLIGGSVAMALKDISIGIRTVGVASRESTVAEALGTGYFDEAYQTDDTRIDRILAGGGVDLVLLAMPPQHARGYFERIENSGYRGIVTDTVSTKTEICRIAEDTLSDPTRFIPGHPMAGREVNGLAGATQGLFAGRYWILCPDSRTDHDAFLALHSLVVAMGARCISLPREEHDNMVALISHVPHMVASSLVELARRHAGEGEELYRITGGGFKDSTRVAAGSPELWTEIAMSNRGPISQGLKEFGEIVGHVEEMVAEGDEQGLESFLEGTSSTRQRIPAAWSATSEKLWMLQVSMENHPGIVAAVTSIAGKLGCNIQSIDIEHISSTNAILELVFTDEGDMAGLLEALADEGFEVVSDGFVEVQS